jgi:hypothetical protein
MMVQLEARLQYITGLVITLPEADTEPREGEEIVQVTGTEETVNHSLCSIPDSDQDLEVKICLGCLPLLSGLYWAGR